MSVVLVCLILLESKDFFEKYKILELMMVTIVLFNLLGIVLMMIAGVWMAKQLFIKIGQGW